MSLDRSLSLRIFVSFVFDKDLLPSLDLKVIFLIDGVDEILNEKFRL